MVRWPWIDSRGEAKWADLPEDERELIGKKTSTWDYTNGRFPDLYEDFIGDLDHPNSPYDRVGDPEVGDTVEIVYELDESLRDELKNPWISHHVLMRFPVEWQDAEKLKAAVDKQKKPEVHVVKDHKCPTCGHSVRV